MLYILPRVVLQVKASVYYKTINNKNKKTYFILPRGGRVFLGPQEVVGGSSSLRIRGSAGSGLETPRPPAAAPRRSVLLLTPRTAEGGCQLLLY